MTETTHARGRRAALAGLLVQFVVALGVYGLAFSTVSMAVMYLALFLAAGIPLWLATLLVLRQKELAALEQLDLEQLRREKQTSGGGAAIFGQEGASGLGYMVAQTRLEWMVRYLLPAFGVFSALLLIVIGVLLSIQLHGRFGPFDIYDKDWLPLRTAQVPLAMILLSLVCLILFFFGRYATGMARVADWQLLRGCGGYMLGNSVATLGVIIAFGANLYRGIETWEHTLAFAIPLLMGVLGIETLLSFVLDLYRPRTPGTIARASYDSRLMGLLSEPGGIAHSLREAINYQFGFQVTQSWFYLLLERAALPLIWTAGLALWLLSGVVVVEPYERAIVEHYGRQVNADHPLEPGLHFKLPYPIETVTKFNTDQLYEIEIGFKAGYAPKELSAEEKRKKAEQADVELWTDDRHEGQEHFNFLLPPKPQGDDNELPTVAATSAPVGNEVTRSPVWMSRMHIAIQFRLRGDKLAEHTSHATNPEDILKAIAWNEVLQTAASTDIFALMGPERPKLAEGMRQRIAKRAEKEQLGYEIVYVGILGVHPERTVSEAFRRVVTAQQEQIGDIRKVQVDENKLLTGIAGDRTKALALALAIDRVNRYDDLLDKSGRRLTDAGVLERSQKALAPLESKFNALVEAEWRRDRADQAHQDIENEFKQGLGRSLAQRQELTQALDDATRRYAAVDAELQAALRGVDLGKLSADQRSSAVDYARGKFGKAFWSRELEQTLVGLEGAAAVTLANAQAARYEKETRAGSEVALLQNERMVYNASPKIYKVRRYLEVLTVGIHDARKYLLAFNPAGRQVRVTYDAHEQASPDIGSLPGSKTE